MSFRIEDNLDAVIEALDQAAERCVSETARAIAEDARARAPRLSGALQAGIYAATEGDTGAHEAAVNAVRAANPKTGTLPGNVVEGSRDGHHVAYVESIAAHSPYIHNGVSNRAPRPFLEDAANANEGTFERNLQQIGDDLKKF